MQKIKFRLPATVTNLGPGLGSLGLALGLYATVEVSGRADDKLEVTLTGEGADAFDTPLRHPVVRAMSRFFQRLERTKLGINIRVDNNIPLGSGLGAETAFAVAGVLGANNLMGDPYNREEALELAASISNADGAVATLMGGLAAGILHDNLLIHRTLPVKPFPVVVVVPELDNYIPPSLPDDLPRADVLYNMARIPLMLEAMRHADMKLLASILDDRLREARLTDQISGFGHVAELAARRGALKVIPCGEGPALLALAESRHDRIADEMRLAFKSAGIEARAWVLSVDTQGVVISFAQSV